LCVAYAELSQPDNWRSCQLNISENERLNLNSLLHNWSDGTQATVDVLQIIVQRLILDADGTIVDFELNSPFAYLYQLMKGQCSSDDRSNSSKLVALGAQTPGAPSERRSSPIYGGSGSETQFESRQVDSPITDVPEFLASLRFDKRNLLEELHVDLSGK
jgi:hypothetical protein